MIYYIYFYTIKSETEYESWIAQFQLIGARHSTAKHQTNMITWYPHRYPMDIYISVQKYPVLNHVDCCPPSQGFDL